MLRPGPDQPMNRRRPSTPEIPLRGLTVPLSPGRPAEGQNCHGPGPDSEHELRPGPADRDVPEPACQWPGRPRIAAARPGARLAGASHGARLSRVGLWVYY